MLQDILNLISEYGFISRVLLASKLNVSLKSIDNALFHLINMGYIIEEEKSLECDTVCSKCSFINTCQKDIIKTYILSDKIKP